MATIETSVVMAQTMGLFIGDPIVAPTDPALLADTVFLLVTGENVAVAAEGTHVMPSGIGNSFLGQ